MPCIRTGAVWALAFVLLVAADTRAGGAATTLEILTVDASDAPRQVWHATLHVPIAGGEVVLAYPKWIPGSHGPTGPIASLASIRATADGLPVPWTRDANDVYAFHFMAPAGARALDVTYDLFEGGAGNGDITAQLAVLDWNAVVLYPRDAGIRDVQVRADITLPAGWTEATALPLATPQQFGRPAGHVQFAPATLERLVDSPLYAGAHERVVPLTDADRMTSEVDLFGEADTDIAPSAVQTQHWKNLVAEADALYGARHWVHYHFLLTLSDAESGRGREHHESSANGLSGRYLTDPESYDRGADVLAHEFTHSWNGKYRRPFGLMTKNYQAPMIDDDLWVYEGLTQYYGNVLASRSGLAPRGTFVTVAGNNYATLDAEPGRLTRPLLDTARAQGLTREAQSRSGFFQRRGEDYYSEAALMWLDADTMIRAGTNNRRSLDDFAKRFLGNGGNTPPIVVGYDRKDVIAALAAVYPHDWARFLHERVDLVQVHPPIDGITRGGYRVVYTAERTALQTRAERSSRGINATYSLGSSIAFDGSVPFTIEGMPLARAGIGPGTKILAVNDQAFTPERLRLALRAARSSRAPIRLIVDDLGSVTTRAVDYHGGERYVRLVRDPAKPDLLAAIAAPHARGVR